MTCKQFFKSTAFKCLAVLLAIVIICSVFLTICNSLFYVSDEEKFARAISKIYGQTVETTAVEVTSDKASQGDATINSAYKVTSDGNYLINSTGNGGFSNGTVTCWVVVEMNGTTAISGIGKVVIDSNEGQSYISKVTSSYLNSFSTTYKADTAYSTDNDFVATGASKSSNAICNAVNGAISFVKTAVLGQTTTDPLEGMDYTANVIANGTSYTVENGSVHFTVRAKGVPQASSVTIDVVVGADGKITSFTLTKAKPDDGYIMYSGFETLMVGKNKDDILALIGTADGNYDGKEGEHGSTQDSSVDNSLHTGATETNYACLYAGLFATANYEKVLTAQGGNS